MKVIKNIKLFIENKNNLFLFAICLVTSFFTISVKAVNIQQFSRSSSVAFEMIEDARVENSHVFSDYDWLINMGFSFVNEPLTVKNSNNSEQLDSIIDKMFGVHLGGSYYFKEYLQLSLQSYWSQFKNAQGDSLTSFGDLDLRLKLRVYNSEKKALSIIPRVTIPMGQSEISLIDSNGFDFGSSTVTSGDGVGYGARLVYEHVFKYIQLAANLGITFNDKAKLDTVFGTQIDNTQVLFTGLGIYIPVQNRWGVNIEWARNWTAPLFNDNLNPTETFIGTSFGLTRSMVGFAGLGFGNLFSNTDGNDWRAVAGVKFAARNNKEKRLDKPVALYKPSDDKNKKYIFGSSNLLTFLFSNNIYKLKVSQKNELKMAAQIIKENIHKVELIVIQGHTSSVHTNEYNNNLGMKRAEEVMSLLIKFGVPKEKIKKIQTLGEEALLMDGESQEDHRLNRRVEVHVKLHDN